MKENKGMTNLQYFLLITIISVYGVWGMLDRQEIKAESQQSKQHHERFHNLIIDSVKTHSIIDRMTYDIGCDLKSVTINCDKFVD